jgi:Family of unknown function (DUF6502)
VSKYEQNALLMISTPISSIDESDRATVESALAILEPLAGLLLSRGVRHARAEDLLKLAFVRASARAYAAQDKLPSISALSVATGLRRREVQRLLDAEPLNTSAPKMSMAAQARARWTSDPHYLDAQGQPCRLPRVAPEGQPSFASLAAMISKDVHPRPLLDELVRIGAAEEDGDYVLLRGVFNAPDRSWDALVEVGSTNVADHLSAVLVNLLTQPRPLFEQAVFADGLTQESAQRAANLAKQMWLQTAPDITQKLQTLVNLDEKVPDNNWRMRIGLYSYIAPAHNVPVKMRSARQPGTSKKPRNKGVNP